MRSPDQHARSQPHRPPLPAPTPTPAAGAVHAANLAYSARRADELAEETEAFEREYVDDHSWEQLQEDEHGRLRPLVRSSWKASRYRRAQADRA